MGIHHMKTVCGSACILFACAFGLASVGHAAGLVAAWGDNTQGQTRLPSAVNGIKAIAAGGDHSLALKANGRVIAWGYNNYGQTSVPPVLSNVVAIAAGRSHSLALKADGGVVGWGDNFYGQASVTPDLSNVVAVAAGEGHSLALLADGRVAAWGNYYNGQTSVPSNLSNVVAIAAGEFHSLALKTDGNLAAWGAYASDGWARVPASLSNVTAIAAGASHDLALKADGTVVAWGLNSSGQTNVPAGLSNVVAIAAGGFHSLALRADGSVVSWGGNHSGQTNVPPGLANVSAIAAGGLHSLALVSDGPIQSIRVENLETPHTSNATFSVVVNGWAPFSYQWFRFHPAYLSFDPIVGATNATLTIPNAQFSDMGSYAVCVSNRFGSVLSESATLTVISPPFITAQWTGYTGRVGAHVILSVQASGTPPLSYQWRYNGANVPGATNSSLDLPDVQISSSGCYSVQVTNLYGSTESAEGVLTVTNGPPIIWQPHPTNQVVAVGGTATLVVKATGSQPISYQWRFNSQDIPGATNDILTLPQVRFDQTGYYSVAVGNPFGEIVSSKALLSVVQVLVWSKPTGAYPSAPSGLTNVISVSAGEAHILALKADHTVTAWAFNYYAESSVTNVPPGLSNVAAIAAGPRYNLVLKTNGTVVAWGTHYSTPAVPSGLSNVIAIAAGGAHALAVKTNGAIVTWGSNSSGQTNVPAGLSNVIAAAAGSYHSLALKADGTVTAWGGNSYGQSAVPASVTNVIAIAAAGERSMALRRDGTVMVWGYYPPILPAGLSNVVAITLGGNWQVLALRADGSVVRWGSSPAPTPPGLTNAIAIAAGGSSGFSVAAIGSGAPAFTIQPATQTTIKGGSVQFHARAVGIQPMSYQWQFDGENIPGATDDNLALTGVQGTNLGSYRVMVSNALGAVVSPAATLTIPYPGTLATSLDATHLVWTNVVPTAPWFGQNRETHDGDDAAQSSPIGDDRFSILQTRVVGPGTLTFWWKVSSEPGYDYLKFIGPAGSQLAISGETDWQQQTVPIAAGSQTLMWIYEKDTSVANGKDAGWLDEVVFTPSLPAIIGQPRSQTATMGSKVTFEVAAIGATPLSYQWIKDGTDLAGATGAILTLTNLTRRDSAIYAVSVSNAAGSKRSSNAVLRVWVPQRLEAPSILADGSLVFMSSDADGGVLMPGDGGGFAAQVSTNLVDWETLPDELEVTNGVLFLHDASRSNYSARFYRIIEH